MGGAIFAAVVVGVVYFSRGHHDWGAIFQAMAAWIQARGPEAVMWLLILQALQVLLAVPGPFFTMVAGFLYGTTMGTTVAVAGTTAGSVIAYGLARLARAAHGTREAAAAIGNPPCEPSGRFATFRRVVMGGGWKVVLSSRLIPFFPFKLSNYFFGWVRFPFGAFFWGTFLGIIPVTLISVSAGALASDLASLAHPDFSAKGRWGGALAGLAVAAVMLAWAGWKARAEIRRASRNARMAEEARGEKACEVVGQGAGNPG
jgi:uncharacterized membrane protein YdjX (TVP38/TMEM64 family)